jgi:hypothetical protein
VLTCACIDVCVQVDVCDVCVRVLTCACACVDVFMYVVVCRCCCVGV